jgi:hypothetical protein
MIKVDMERFTVTSLKPFDAVVAAIKASIGHGMIVRKGTEHHTSRIIRLVIGNPLIMKEMAKRVPDAGSYAPVTVLVDERADGVNISYDRMASLGTHLSARPLDPGPQ